jgi:hypothetical protein
MFSSSTSTTCHTSSTNASNAEHAIGSSNCNTLNQAREYIHEAFKTAEQRQAEKSVMEKIEDAAIHMPQEVAASVSESLNSGLQSVEYKLQHRLHEDSKHNRLEHAENDKNRPSSAEKVAASSMSDNLNSGFLPEFLKSVEDLSQVWPNDGSGGKKLGREEDDKGFVSNSVNATKDVMGSVRENIYDATKSAEEKETEKQSEKSCKEKLNEAIHLRS